jgi:ubiquinone/menaquinone biosynthesis C-methylase UbiE
MTVLRRARRNLPLGVRADAPELLDGDGLSPRDIERNLADLARLNRLPGGTGASVTAVGRLLDGVGVGRILDVGAGRGDMPMVFARRGLSVTALDVHPDVLLVMHRMTRDEPRIDVVEGDARALPFEDAAFDVRHASLLVHHLDPDDAVAALREMRRVARRGVVINDLRRGVLPLLATAVSVAALGRSRVTHSDGLASARRAYTVQELDELLDEAGLAVSWRSAPWMPRVVTVATPGERR